jgi:D-cysteine desulfhydrase
MIMHPKEPPRLRLAQLPTPIVELKNLARDLGVERILMKRDDLTGVEVSGNKVRKLEYLVADALAQGCDTLVTHGGYQSNHCRATAAVGARLGLRVRLILRSPEDQPANDGNLFLDRMFGAHVSLHSVEEYNQQRKQLIDDAIQAERRAGHRPYFFPVGASVPLGCWGYINCIAEMVEQLGNTPLDIYSAVSSAGTHTGLMIGRALLSCSNWRVIGIPVSDSIDYFQREIRQLERETNTKFDLGLSESDTPIELIDGYIGAGYAIPYPAATQTLKTVARREGILLDPTYTAKGMTGFLDQIHKHQTRAGATPIFIHTGGVFGLLARRDLFPPEENLQ